MEMYVTTHAIGAPYACMTCIAADAFSSIGARTRVADRRAYTRWPTVLARPVSRLFGESIDPNGHGDPPRNGIQGGAGSRLQDSPPRRWKVLSRQRDQACVVQAL
jgi:hypothetical protein